MYLYGISLDQEVMEWDGIDGGRDGKVDGNRRWARIGWTCSWNNNRGEADKDAR